MIIAAAALGVVFSVVTGVFGVLALRGMRQDIPFRGRIGLPGPEVRVSKAAWDRGHAAAAPLVGIGAAISLLQVIGCAGAIVIPDFLSAGYLIQLAGFGLILLIILSVLAVRIGRRSARGPANSAIPPQEQP